MCCPSTKSVTLILSLTGILLSLYALHVETQASKDPEYVALCDISSMSLSCSKVLTSSYGRGFGLVALLLGEEHPLNQPNSVYGIIFYSIMMLLAFLTSKVMTKLQFYLSLASVAMSLYLAYILYYILAELCPLCVSTYAVNFLLFITSWCKKRSLNSSSSSKGSRRVESTFTLPTNNQDFKKFI
eukprot:TRINITY_DN67252_c0_g1_i1.p1 TRINITY_DN67252_c0_g1~~TRINITY_DN67252_c0_g1_i1.p1  ORF type:complete len:185 (-),score=56.76 TRINITY_DN67252_c0_g1_i1:149-703(-)